MKRLVNKMLLKEIIEFKNGKKKPSSKGSIPIYGGNGILGYTDQSNQNEESLIIGRVGAYCGCVYSYYGQCWVSDNAIVGKVNEGNDFYYCYYLLKRLNLNSRHVGSGQPLMTQEILNNIEINICDYETQRKVGKILKNIDDKIKINSEINNNLYEQINYIYKETFKDYQTYKRLDEVSNVTIGKTPPRSEQECFTNNKNDIKWISISDLGKSGVFIYDTNEKLKKDAVEKYNIKVIPEDTIILSFKLTVGRVGITTEDMTTNEAIAHFDLYNKKYKNYLYCMLKNYNYNDLGSTSSIATAINSKIVKSMKIGIPYDNDLEKFNNLTFSMFDLIKLNEKNNIYLEQLRDTLLPKLMSGEIDLDNIEI